VRPARFAVGLGERVQWEHLAVAKGAPLLPAFHLGLVEEVVPAEDLVLITLWERPSGRESATELSIREHLHGEVPVPGALLRLWTWMELPSEGGQPVSRVHVEVEQAHLTDAEREHLGVLIEKLSRASPRARAREGDRDGST
jgi:hypothetical protein